MPQLIFRALDFSPSNGYQGGIVAQNNQDQIPDTSPLPSCQGSIPKAWDTKVCNTFAFSP